MANESLESLLSVSGIKLFGRIIRDLAVSPGKFAASLVAVAVKEEARRQSEVPEDEPGKIAEKAKEALDQVLDGDDELSKLTAQSVYDYVMRAASQGKVEMVKAAELRAAAFGADPGSTINARRDANRFLRSQLEAGDAAVARIYGFSFEGAYYNIPRPIAFLVHGLGEAIKIHGTYRSDVDTSGVIARDWEFASPKPDNDDADIRMWEYDKGDFSIRLDIETGQLEQILLDAMGRGAGAMSGSDARLSGSDARLSGSDARLSGSDARLSGSDLRRR